MSAPPEPRVRRSRRAALGAIAMAGCLALAPARASAQPSRDAVLYLYNQGKELMEARRFAEACDKFEKAKHLDPKAINLLLRLGDCYEKLGRTATAYAQYKEVAAVAAAAKDRREADALERVKALEPKLSRLVVSLPPLSDARGLEVKINGAVTPRAELGRDAPVDPGPYTIEASAPGKKRWSVTHEVAPNGARVDVMIPPLEDLVATPSGGPAAPAGAPSPGLGTRRTIAVAVGAAGIVGVGVGIGFGVKALANKNASNEGHCDAKSYCDDTGFDLRKEARQAGTISTVAFAAGAALGAGGVVLFLTAPPRRSGSAARLDFFAAPAPGGGAAGLRGSF